MIYLILKIFVYLLLALFAGAGAGWVLRHMAAAKQEEEMQRTLADVRARVPQFESLIRSRDEQIGRLKEDLKEKDARINGLLSDLREAESRGREKERELKAAVAQHETLMTDEQEPAQESAGMLIGGGEILDIGADETSHDGPAQERVRQLEAALAEAKAQAADAVAEAAAAEAEVITLKAALAGSGNGAAGVPADGAISDLEARLAQKTMDYERLARDLELSQRRVTELERERELQNKSLQVLHQQLELERERGQRVASA